MSLTSKGFIPALLHKASACGNATFVSFEGRSYDFDEIERASRAFAQRLRKMGLHQGDRVAVMLRNSPELIACIFGVARAGLVWVPINPELRSNSLKYVIEHAEPSLLIACDDSLSTVHQSHTDLSRLTTVILDESWSMDALLQCQCAPLNEAPPSPDSLFSIMYTSGTTGQPKGVLVTHKMICYAAEAAILLADTQDGDVLYMWEPMFHVAGAQVLFMPLRQDLRIALTPRFSASRFWDDVRSTGATHIHYLGGVLQILMKQPPSEHDLNHSARVAWGAGCAPDIWESFQQRFGLSLRESYGMTETSSIASFNGSAKVASVGNAVPWFTIRVLDAQGQAVPPGELGEIVVTPKEAGSVFAGYFRNEETTRDILRNGSVYTKDIGSFDADGDLFFYGRMTDSIRYRGENVSAWEIESIVSKHPSIAACAVIGVKAEIGEQDIKLFVQFKAEADTALSFYALSQWLEQHLAPHQNPRYIERVDEFERTPSQRIKKHTLSTATTQSWDRLQHPSLPSNTAQQKAKL